MILYTETHAHTLRHRLAHSHALVRTRTHTCAIQLPHTHSSLALCVFFTVCLPYTRSHSQIYTNTLYKSVCAQTPTRSLLNSLFLTLTLSHTRSHTCQYCGQAFFKPLLTHSPLAVFGRQDDEEWFKTEMHDMFPYKATQFETQHLCFSLSLHQACIKERREGKKKAPA